MDTNIKKINYKLEGKKWEDAKEKAYKEALKKVKIDGFRQGKAPKEVFLKKYKKENLYLDAADLCLKDIYEEVLNENKDLEIIAQPEIQVDKIDEKGVDFTFILTLKPTVTLGKYKNLKAKKDKIKVTKEEIEHEIEHLKEHFAENIIKEGKIEKGDIAVIDFKGLKDGVPFEGGEAKNYALTIGSHTFIEGFEEQLIGLKKNDEKDVKVTFPEDYHQEDLKGQEVTFKIKVNEIKTKHIPDLDDEFFEDLGLEGVNTKESLEKHVKEVITSRKEMEAEDKYIDELLEEAGKDTKVDIPEIMIQEELDRMIKQYSENLKMQGMSIEQFYKFTNSDEDSLKEQIREEAVKRITYRLMLEEIAKVENIKITEKEALEEAEKLALKYQMDVEEFKKAFGGIEMVKYDLQMRKAIEVLKTKES